MKKTKQKVFDSMKALHYQPNDVARQLFSKETKMVGLIFPTIANPFFWSDGGAVRNEAF